MAQTIATNALLEQIAQGFKASEIFVGAYFKIGEGGWVQGTTQAPREPDPTLTDLDCIVNPDRYPADSRFVFQKALTDDDISTFVLRRVTFNCFVDFTEANVDDNANPPEFWEIGIYSAGDTLLVYRTFDKQTKMADRSLRHTITVIVANEE